VLELCQRLVRTGCQAASSPQFTSFVWTPGPSRPVAAKCVGGTARHQTTARICCGLSAISGGIGRRRCASPMIHTSGVSWKHWVASIQTLQSACRGFSTMLSASPMKG